MSALEIDALPDNPADRRREPRLRLTSAVPTRIGRGAGSLVDISMHGMRVRHSTPAGRGTRVRVSFDWRGERFSANAEVLASRVAALTSDGGTLFESRLRFVDITGEAEEVLDRVLGTIRNRDLRRWVANLRGWTEEDGGTNVVHGEARVPVAPPMSAFVRCRLRDGRWEKKWTRDGTQPLNGFVVPATVDEGEISRLCMTYEQIDADGRHLLRLMAAAVVDDRVAGV
jgi:hypothetical protein